MASPPHTHISPQTPLSHHYSWVFSSYVAFFLSCLLLLQLPLPLLLLLQTLQSRISNSERRQTKNNKNYKDKIKISYILPSSFLFLRILSCVCLPEVAHEKKIGRNQYVGFFKRKLMETKNICLFPYKEQLQMRQNRPSHPPIILPMIVPSLLFVSFWWCFCMNTQSVKLWDLIGIYIRYIPYILRFLFIIQHIIAFNSGKKS